MVYTTNIPQANDQISNSQAQILGNFQFLGDTTGNTANGFYKLPNGLIVQWGFYSGAAVIDDVAQTFAGTFVGCIAFPTNCLSIIFQPIKNSPNNHTFYLKPSSLTNTGFRVITNTTWGQGFHFMAIGN